MPDIEPSPEVLEGRTLHTSRASVYYGFLADDHRYHVAPTAGPVGIGGIHPAGKAVHALGGIFGPYVEGEQRLGAGARPDWFIKQVEVI